jgi:hypothetical protein
MVIGLNRPGPNTVLKVERIAGWVLGLAMGLDDGLEKQRGGLSKMYG